MGSPRGIKHGLAEIDLLAIRHEAETPVNGWHVEVQVSFRPVTYIAKLTDDMARASNRLRTNASARTPDQIETCASEWVQSKFKADAKAKAREGLGRTCNGGTISSMHESASAGSLRCFKGRA